MVYHDAGVVSVARAIVAVWGKKPMVTEARELFFHSGTQHYVAGGFAAIAALIPVAGNLLHHAVEMFIKGGLSAARSLDQLKGMGHNLPRIWSEWKSLYPDPAHTKFDGVITNLHPFEELRYPNAVLAHGAGVTIDMGRGPRPVSFCGLPYGALLPFGKE